jgi:hypothetical protein
VLLYADLDGRALSIKRGTFSDGVLGSTKTGRSRRMTLGATTVALVRSHFSTRERLGPAPLSVWLFAAGAAT